MKLTHDKLLQDVPEDATVIKTFYDLMDEIAYSWHLLVQDKIRRHESGIFLMHGLAIGKNWAQYKEDWYRLEPGVYEKLEIFYELIQEM